MVLDGWGIRRSARGNAILAARTPVMDRLWRDYPHTRLDASGEAVGLTAGQMGNSNVGHLTIGAGRIVWQDLVRIDRAIREGSFFTNPVLRQVMEETRASGHVLHLLGLLSDGGVHSHIRHLLALLEMAARVGLRQVCVHAFLDGRDTPPRSAEPFLREAQEKAESLGFPGIATVSGRYYAMDRDRRWERTERAYRALVEGRGLTAPDPVAALHAAYERGEGDEFVQPTVVTPERLDGRPLGRIRPGDGVIFFNFRADRARQLTHALTDAHFDPFPVERLDLRFVTMTRYEEGLALPVAFPKPDLADTLGELVARAGGRQLRIAETEKYAHVTYFFNGGEERQFEGEDRILVPSPKVATYDLKPEMSAPEIAERLRGALAAREYRLVVLNFANADMVGHTGDFDAAVRAVETVDGCVGEVVEAALERQGAVLVTADHGNAEEMLDEATGQPHTAHTSNPVPFIAVVPGEKPRELAPGGLRDVAPTALGLLGLPRPEAMEGRDLLAGGEGDGPVDGAGTATAASRRR
ncbi:MAG: 2,3-bisphosphoglycerate-independent phosphoglycerate mutase [Bacillota bacterium]|nr:2,3-bisphosphoglycerate-independent phosphoglycerate mutase [Bacillota bacterium]